MSEASYLEYFPEANEVNPEAYSTAVVAYKQLIEAVISNRTMLDVVGSVDLETMQVHTSDLGMGMSHSVGNKEIDITFDESTNILLQEALSTYGLTDSEEKPTIRISFDGEHINTIPVKILSTLGDPKKYSAKEFLAMANVAQQVTEQMLLHPDNFITWMTAMDPDAREFAQFEPLLNTIIDYGIRVLPFNSRILSKLVADGKMIPNHAVAYKHDILEIDADDPELEGNPLMGEIYTMELSANQEVLIVNEKPVQTNSIKITHRVAAMFADAENMYGKVAGRISVRKEISKAEDVSGLVAEWGPDSAISSGVAYINIAKEDNSHIAIRHTNRSGAPISINTGTNIYSLSFFDTKGNYAVSLTDAKGKTIESQDIDAKDKVIIAKLLVTAPNYLINAASSEE